MKAFARVGDGGQGLSGSSKSELGDAEESELELPRRADPAGSSHVQGL